MPSEEKWNCVDTRKRSTFLLAGVYLAKMASVNTRIYAHTGIRVCTVVYI